MLSEYLFWSLCFSSAPRDVKNVRVYVETKCYVLYEIGYLVLCSNDVYDSVCYPIVWMCNY